MFVAAWYRRRVSWMEQNISSSMSTFFQVQVSLYQSQNLSMMVRATKNVFPYIRSKCFEAWKMTKKHQEAKMKETKLEAEVVKTGLSSFGYRSIRFS
jgi:hypothetical protein